MTEPTPAPIPASEATPAPEREPGSAVRGASEPAASGASLQPGPAEVAGTPARCAANGCTPEECVCGEDDLDPAEQALLDAVTVLHPTLNPTERGWLSEFVDDGVMLTVVDANLTLVRLYLNRRDGLVYTVPADVDDADDMREALADSHRRRAISVALTPPTPLPFQTSEPENTSPGAPDSVPRSRPPAPAWSRPAPGAHVSERQARSRSPRRRQRHADPGRRRR